MSAHSFAHLTPDEKRALLKRLLAERAASDQGDFPLSQGQQALWFLQKLLPETSAYNVVFTARVQPKLDLDALQRSLNQLVARHPGLRTVFPEYNGQPVQRVLPPAAAPLRVIEMDTASIADVNHMVCADYHRPFCMEQALFAVSVYRRADEDILLINVHHLVFDAWSLQILFQDLRALYEAELRATPAALPPLTTQYKDFVTWQSNIINSTQGETLYHYWSTILTPLPPALEIAASKSRPPLLPLRGASIPFSLDPELSAALHALAKHQHTTLYTVMLAAMQVLLYQFSGQTDITIGTPVSLRAKSEWSNIIGYFINMLPVRGTITEHATFAEHLDCTRERALGALVHQELPFPLMVDRLKIRREPNRSPIFQAMLNVNVSPRTSELSRLFDPHQTSTIPFGNSRLASYPIPQQEGQFEIVIEIADIEGTLYGTLKYHTDLFNSDTAHNMVAAYQSILQTVTANPQTQIGSLTTDSNRDAFII